MKSNSKSIVIANENKNSTKKHSPAHLLAYDVVIATTQVMLELINALKPTLNAWIIEDGEKVIIRYKLKPIISKIVMCEQTVPTL